MFAWKAADQEMCVLLHRCVCVCVCVCVCDGLGKDSIDKPSRGNGLDSS